MVRSWWHRGRYWAPRWDRYWDCEEVRHHHHRNTWAGVYATWYGGGGWGHDYGCW